MVVKFLCNLAVLFSIISLFNFIRYSLKIKKVLNMHKDNPNVKGIMVVNGHVRVIEKKPGENLSSKAQQKVLIKDEVCQKQMSQEEAYCVVVDGKKHYFCSWECREAFLRKETEDHESGNHNSWE